mmetsp:Transcript_64740/g.76003  ORF Transcript_64740/g.76003 Transcript_64740/m.76003 type:complete len:105 (+) Transcript_64740:36-350(+)
MVRSKRSLKVQAFPGCVTILPNRYSFLPLASSPVRFPYAPSSLIAHISAATPSILHCPSIQEYRLRNRSFDRRFLLLLCSTNSATSANSSSPTPDNTDTMTIMS